MSATRFQQTITLPGTPQRVFDALMSSADHSAFTGGPAEIDPADGGAFSCHGGQIVGFTLETVPGERIVQAWRVAGWPAGVFSMVRYDLSAQDGGTQVVLTHDAVPDGAADMLKQGWYDHYWNKLPGFLQG